MPRIVDHHQRRREVADALLEIVAEQGTAAVTIRGVATRSGWSTGVISHYFVNRHDLLLGGLRRAAELAAERQKEIGRTLLGKQAVEAVLEENLPLDKRRLALSRIFIFFYAEAAADDAVRREIDGYIYKWKRQTEIAIRAAQESGDIDPDIDPVAAAHGLVGLSDGLSVHALFNDDLLAWLRDTAPIRQWVNLLSSAPIGAGGAPLA